MRMWSLSESFVPGPSFLYKTLGVDLSRPSGYRLIKSRDWEVLQVSNTSHVSVVCVRE